MARANPCTHCGLERADDELGGLCPRCLLDPALQSRPSGATASVPGERGLSHGTLDRLSSTIGEVPLVLLREADPEGNTPPARPSSPEMPSPADRTARVQLLGEIARGGMGAVLKGRDPDLGRDLAVKVLLEQHRQNPDLVRRFVEEAQIAGQLQHPGVVPVYELGCFADRRPFFSMKLVKGQTLAALLAARPAPADGLPRLLDIFEQVCQTVAYAHARGVIHRDLKPSNVMVGSFGEVQVMDWGLAKVLPKGGAADDATAGKVPDQETVIATARSGSDSDLGLSRAGSVMGTPAYMAPEQARGEVESVDERADVFALGSILCEVLTGQPAFTGRTSAEIQRLSARGETAEALWRLDACGAAAELITLARECLACDPRDRPRDAGAVAARVTAYRVGVQERLRAAELARATESARADEAERRAKAERRARRSQLGLAAALLALLLVGGVIASSVYAERQRRAERLDRVLTEARALRDSAQRQADDPAAWRNALAALRRTEELGPEAPQAAALRGEIHAGLERAESDARLRARLVEIRADSIDMSAEETDRAFTVAFADAGLDLDRLGAEEFARRLRERRGPVVIELAAFLDYWYDARRVAGRLADDWRRLVDAARRADPDPSRDRLRTALREEDIRSATAVLREMAATPETVDLPAPTAVLLGGLLARLGDPEAALAVLRSAATRYPGDVWVNYKLAQTSVQMRPPAREEAVRYYSAARAIRPETTHQLCHLLEQMGRGAEAEALFRDLCNRRPESNHALVCLGKNLNYRGRPDAQAVLQRAVALCREQVSREPGNANSRVNLGIALSAVGDPAGAAAAAREAIRLKPNYFEAHAVLGEALRAAGDLPGSAAAEREAIRLKPNYADAHYGLGYTLRAAGDLPGAIAAFREAVRLVPHFADAHQSLGLALREAGDPAGAVAALRESIRLKPDDPNAYNNLGQALNAAGDPDAALAAHREAIRLRPDSALFHYQLAGLFYVLGRLDEAVASCREAVRLDGEHLGEAIYLLGGLYRRLGRYEEAGETFRRAEKMARAANRDGEVRRASRELEIIDRRKALQARLPVILRGADRPRDHGELSELGEVCRELRLYGAGARYLDRALQDDPALDGEGMSHPRWLAGCLATLAGFREGVDRPPLDQAERSLLRGLALRRLKAELAADARHLDADPARNRDAVAGFMRGWQADLACARDADALAKLPAPEQEAWRALWTEVDGLLRRASGDRP